MQKVTLDFTQRLSIVAVLAQSRGGEDETDAFARVAEAIDLTEAERQDANLRMEGAFLRWDLPTPDFGTREFSLETHDAKAVYAALKTWKGYTMADRTWRNLAFEALQPTTRIAEAKRPAQRRAS